MILFSDLKPDMSWTWTPEENCTWNETFSSKGRSETSGELCQLEKEILIYLSAGISATGIISNSLSLTFFFRNWSQKLGDQLLVLLNILDFLVLLSGTINFVMLHFLQNASPITKRLFPVIYLTFVECTGYATTLLTIIRTLVTYFPFFKPMPKHVATVFVLLFMYSVIKGAVHVHKNYVQLYNNLHLVTLLLIIAVVFTANLLTIKKLYTKENTRSSIAVLPSIQANRHATITIFILSACFCFFNLLFSIVLCNYILGREFVTVMLRKTIVYCAVPMNSAGNPFVYFCRKREMRIFLRRNFEFFTCRPKLLSQPESTATSLKLPTQS